MHKGQFSYENDVSAAFLTYTLDSTEELDKFGMGMLRNNQIHGILPVTYTQFDMDRKLKMNVTGTAVLSDYLKQTINRTSLLNVLSSITKTLIESEGYLLDMDEFIFDFDRIYTNVSTGVCKMIYLPVEKEPEQVDLSGFFRSILFSVKSNTTEDNSHIISVMNYLADGNFDLKGFAELTEQLQKTKVRKSTNTPIHSSLSDQPSISLEKPAQTKVPEKKVESISNPVQKPQLMTAEPERKEPEQNKQFDDRGYEEKPKLFGLNLFKKKEQHAENEKKNKSGNKSDYSNDLYSSEDFGFAIPGRDNGPAYEKKNTVINKPIDEPVSQQLKQPEKKPIENKMQTAAEKTVKDKWYMGIGETVVLSDQNLPSGTTVLTTDMRNMIQVKPRLIRKKNGEVIPITSNTFRLGTEKSYVNYFISDNSAVSRTHASILNKNNSYYVVDTNSLNHTYVNGKMITSNTETELKDGDSIRLANEEFDFKVY